MRCFDLGAAAAVDELKAGKGAPTIVCLEHARSEDSIPHSPSGILRKDVAVKPSPTCSKPPANGELLTDKRASTEKGHVLQIENGTEGPAIVKLRDATTEKTIASFFVEPSRTASLTQIPDGTYRVQYAFGDKLGVDCRTFVQLASAGEFPGTETLTTRYEEEFGGTRISRSRLSYTLYAVPGGNVRPEDIAPSDFNKP